MVRIVLDAGDRRMKNVRRTCRLLYAKNGRDGADVSILEGEIPPNVPVIEITLEEFRATMRRHGLTFRVKHAPVERKQLRERSLTNYRSTPQYMQRRVRTRRENAGMGPLSEAERAAIRESDDRALTLARRYKLSLRDVAAIRAEVPIAV